MDANEMRERFLSDSRAARTAFENDVIDRVDYDAIMERIAVRFDDELEMLAISTPAIELEKILAYS